ncbi:gamma-glutamyltransferase [Purpureocillium lilacinum]|uniref:Gamma-glutamyltransferase n=1 Tax=Purpureocillium lilacinum TaxID=33203 RepID=A0A179GK63_PURLI|nr:gamma-glutamyltransferase [Purpureocillium lilacinum]
MNGKHHQHGGPPSSNFFTFGSRRSVVYSTEGIVACTQPLAAKCGIEILRSGGNAADAAVAVAAGMNMTEPCSTGIGGDMFILYWDAKAKKVHALNGSGRSGKQCSLSSVRAALGLEDRSEGDKIPLTSVHSVTVPGAAAGWVDTVERFGSGKLLLSQVLEPAIHLGEKGFPVSEWRASEKLLKAASPNFGEMLKRDPAAKDGCRAPHPGELMRNPNLAQTFRVLGEQGKAGFYSGRIAREIINVTKGLGGVLTEEDLQHHMEMGSEMVEPISVQFCGQGLGDEGVELWEQPPNGQGLVALLALGIIQEMEKQGKVPVFQPQDFNSAPYLHAIVEALRLAFADGSWYITDPATAKIPVQELMSPEYLAQRATLFDPTKAIRHKDHGTPFPSPALQSSDTVYFAVSDSDGNAASFINSNYDGFGSGIVPKGCGFTLQNRGCNFSLDSFHPNKLEPRKRPYHTIIPGMTTNLSDGSLHSAFGVMGGFMQPQGHVQVLLGLVVGKLGLQEALDAPRVCIASRMMEEGVEDWTVSVEEGMSEETIAGLRQLGHQVEILRGWDRSMFGRGQIIRYSQDPVEGIPIWSGASDPRGDGAAYAAI